MPTSGIERGGDAARAVFVDERPPAEPRAAREHFLARLSVDTDPAGGRAARDGRKFHVRIRPVWGSVFLDTAG